MELTVRQAGDFGLAAKLLLVWRDRLGILNTRPAAVHLSQIVKGNRGDVGVVMRRRRLPASEHRPEMREGTIEGGLRPGLLPKDIGRPRHLGACDLDVPHTPAKA